MNGTGGGHMVRDAAEPVIGPRYARTRWRLLTMSPQRGKRRCTRTMNTVSWRLGSAGSSMSA